MKKGFTLIELLAIIAILAILVIFTVPRVLKIYKESKIKAYKIEAESILKMANQKYKINIIQGKEIQKIVFTYNIDGEESNIGNESLIVSGSKPESGNLVIDKDGQVSFALFKNGLCASKSKSAKKIIVEEKIKGDCKIQLPIPTITLNGNDVIYIGINGTFIDEGATALSSEGVDLTQNITTIIKKDENVVEGIDSSSEGQYIVTYEIWEEGGEKANVIREVNVIDYSVTFNYTGNVQTYTIPYIGTYVFELWGASGGDYIYSTKIHLGGEGGYSKGKITFNSIVTFYLYVGGAGKGGTCTAYQGGWNGGGTAKGESCPGPSYSGGGGGATDIRLVSGTWNNAASLASRIIVAGGGSGGGGSFYSNYLFEGTSGGGISGGGGYGKNSIGNPSSIEGATQTTGNALGVGCSSNSPGISGGGGGYYGGKCLAIGYGSSAGGSGFVPGHSGVAASSNGYSFTETIMESGVNTGNGFIKITLQ